MAMSYVADKAMDKVSDMFTSSSNNEGEMEEAEESKAEKSLLDHLFSESKVDKVLSKYFEVNESEKRVSSEKNAKRQIQKKTKVVKVMESVKKFSETIEQELAAEKFLEENASFNFIGKTNKKNLVFENGNKQTKISPEGLLV
jgi:predicted transcriptional regulator